MRAIGSAEWKKHQQGKRLTLKPAVHAKCFDCMAHYDDGRRDCEMPECPLYSWMPYRGVKPDG